MPKQPKNEKCWKIVTEESKRLLPKITLPANEAVIAITEIILFACSCQKEKCESVFFCGELTQHPEEKMKLQGQKNKIKALETSAAKLEQELRSWEAGF